MTATKEVSDIRTQQGAARFLTALLKEARDKDHREDGPLAGAAINCNCTRVVVDLPSGIAVEFAIEVGPHI